MPPLLFLGALNPRKEQRKQALTGSASTRAASCCTCRRRDRERLQDSGAGRRGRRQARRTSLCRDAASACSRNAKFVLGEEPWIRARAMAPSRWGVLFDPDRLNCFKVVRSTGINRRGGWQFRLASRVAQLTWQTPVTSSPTRACWAPPASVRACCDRWPTTRAAVRLVNSLDAALAARCHSSHHRPAGR